MKQIYKFLLFTLFLAANVVALGQSFTTRVSAKTIGKKDVVQVEYVAENLELQELVLPVFNGWSILSGPNYSSNRLQTGNIVKQEVVYTLTLQPQATGRLMIPGARATIENKIKVSNVVAVEVKEVEHVQPNAPGGGSRPPHTQSNPYDEVEINDDQVLKSGESARDKIRNNLLVRLDVNKKTSYVGEPLLVTYKLCTRIRSQSRVIKQPAFSGCTVLEMTSDDPLPRKEMIGGKWYNVYIIRQVQLIPLQAGPLQLPEASVENTVTFYRAGQVNYRDLFYNNPTSKSEELTVTFKNTPMQVDVKPLPQPVPASFGGAVGSFNLHVINSEASEETKNTNALLLNITGEGNLQQIKTPVIAWPKGIEGFEGTEREDINKQVFPVQVVKTIAYPYVAAKNGNYIIPPVEFTYFDANKNQYVTITSKSVRLNVAKGLNAILPRNSEVHGNNFYIQLYILIGAGLLLLLSGLVWYHRTHKIVAVTPQNVILKQEVIASAPMVDTDQFIFQVRELEPGTDGPTFYRKLHRSISAWLLGKYNIGVTEIDSFSEQYPEKAMALQKLSSVLEFCSLGMYTPVYNFEEALQHRLVALEAINNLEKGG